jgi:hypothetical protein
MSWKWIEREKKKKEMRKVKKSENFSFGIELQEPTRATYTN